ncbi:DNA mismatch repair protein MLH1 [Glycine max]|nr:DNA mismatch repair protein MLH1 [Glycine max]
MEFLFSLSSIVSTLDWEDSGIPPSISHLKALASSDKELMYQQVLSRFGHFNAIQLNDPVPLKDLIISCLKEEDVDSKYNDDDSLKEKIAEVISLWF